MKALLLVYRRKYMKKKKKTQVEKDQIYSSSSHSRRTQPTRSHPEQGLRASRQPESRCPADPKLIPPRPPFLQAQNSQNIYQRVLPQHQPSAPEEVDPNTEVRSTYVEKDLIIHVRIPGALILHAGVLNTHSDHLLEVRKAPSAHPHSEPAWIT